FSGGRRAAGDLFSGLTWDHVVTGFCPVQAGRSPATTWLMHSTVARIERYVQFEYVYARLAEESPLPVRGILSNEAYDFGFRDLAFGSDPPNLKLSRRRRDIRIQP